MHPRTARWAARQHRCRCAFEPRSGDGRSRPADGVTTTPGAVPKLRGMLRGGCDAAAGVAVGLGLVLLGEVEVTIPDGR